MNLMTVRGEGALSLSREHALEGWVRGRHFVVEAPVASNGMKPRISARSTFELRRRGIDYIRFLFDNDYSIFYIGDEHTVTRSGWQA